MDECLVPGILWPYGSPALKKHLAYLTWNTRCANTLANILDGECTEEQRRDAVTKLEQAKNLVEQQSSEIVSAMPQ